MTERYWIKLDGEPIDSPHWYSSSGEEYNWQGNADYMVVNEKIGNNRLRHVCKILKEIKVRPQMEREGDREQP